jgi:hypothetical protein
MVVSNAISKISSIFIFVIGVFVFVGCSQDSESPTQQQKSSGGIAVPKQVKAQLANMPEGEMLAYVSVDGEEPQQMSISSDGATASLTIDNLSSGNHELAITFRYRLANDTNAIDLANTSISVSLSSGPNKPVFNDIVYDLADDDQDNISNLDELVRGSNPNEKNREPTIANPIEIQLAENTIEVLNVNASDPDNDELSLSIVGGDDQALFDLSDTGVLSFINTPDFENPSDSDTNNIYLVTIEASDGYLSVQHALSIEITNAVDLANLNVIASLENTLASQTLPAGTLQAYLILDGGNMQPMTMNSLSASIIVTNLNPGDLTVKVQFEFTADGDTQSIVLAEQQQNNTVNLGENSITFAEGSYVFPDDDNDGISNLKLLTNNAPTANASPDQSVPVNSTVTLDGSNSSDIDGDTLSYYWSLQVPQGSSAVLSDNTAVRPTFVMDVADVNATFTATLVVNDGIVDSAADTVIITSGNVPPVANAGNNQAAIFDEVVTLDGSDSSDANGDTLTYNWTFFSRPNGSTASLSNPNSSMPTFTVDTNEVGVDYVVRLIVNDGTVDSEPSDVTISTGNIAPVADAGRDQVSTYDMLVPLDGSNSYDLNGDNLTYSWSFLSIPNGSSASLSSATGVTTDFTVDVAEVGVDYVVQLVVNDGTTDSTADTVIISTGNVPPVANAGPDQSTVFNETVALDGSASYDVNNDVLTYKWSLLAVPSGSSAVLSDPTAQAPTFVVDVPEVGVNYVAQLIVNDGIADSGPDTVVISTGNVPPVANAGADKTGTVNDTITLDGSASSDVNNDTLTYQWSFTSRPSGSTAVFDNSGAQKPSFVLDKAGTYVAQLIVNDGTVNSDNIDTVNVNSVPLVSYTAYYPFSGNANDVSGNGLNGVVNGPLLTTDRFGNANSAYSFNGVDDDITVAHNPLLDITQQITLAAWIYPTAQKTQEIVRLGAAVNGTTAAPYGLALSGTGDIVFSLRPNLVFTQARRTGYPLNTWTFVVGTYDGTNMKLYVNGVLETTIPISGLLNTTTDPLLIGTRLNLPADTFAGKLDEIQIYNTALTAAQINVLYNQ